MRIAGLACGLAANLRHDLPRATPGLHGVVRRAGYREHQAVETLDVVTLQPARVIVHM